MPSAPLDTLYQIETPEGIDLPLRPAGLLPRSLAFAFDLGLRGLILGILFLALAFLGNLGIGLGSILLFLVSWWYMVLFEVLNQGCSPGKQIMGLRVVQDDGTVAVVSKGLDDGAKVVTAGQSRLQNGTRVAINEAPTNS